MPSDKPTLAGIRERSHYDQPGSDKALLLAALDAVLAVHEPVDAVQYAGPRTLMTHVCSGCGQDDGRWQRWPCPTVRAISTHIDLGGDRG